MNPSFRNSGIEWIGPVPWGTHLVQFYSSKKDMLDVLVPYLTAGLQNNERCMWITSDPIDPDEARYELRKSVPDLDRRAREGQFEILPHDDWYLRDGRFDTSRVIDGWRAKLAEGVERGFDGLRVTGNTSWLDDANWNGFTEYEAAVDTAIANSSMMAICTYDLARCTAAEVLDVVRNHQLAIVKRDGQWDVIESLDRRRDREQALESERKARARAETLVQLHQRITAILGHDLRQPLTVLRLGISGLKRREGHPIGQEQLDRLDRSADRMEQMISQLLDYTRSAAGGGLPIDRVGLDLREIAVRTIEEAEAAYPGRRIELHVTGATHGAWDGGRMYQVFANLLRNAATHGAGHGPIEVRIDGGMTATAPVRIEVINDADPIAPDDIARLFQPFERGASRKNRASTGLGLGLYIVREIVRAHAGTIRIQSAEGRVAFIVTLPRSESMPSDTSAD